MLKKLLTQKWERAFLKRFNFQRLACEQAHLVAFLHARLGGEAAIFELKKEWGLP